MADNNDVDRWESKKRKLSMESTVITLHGSDCVRETLCAMSTFPVYLCFKCILAVCIYPLWPGLLEERKH